VLYGATGGELFLAGRAGERFAVRNSGATAVMEGAGAHLCEYMTGGTVGALGPVGGNVGAGMSGGELFAHDPDGTLPGRLNPDLVAAERPDALRLTRLRELVARHVELTGSQVGTALLADWDRAVTRFWRVAPIAEVASVEERNEGTG
jgi:glutamate synthase (ferredoxin)